MTMPLLGRRAALATLTTLPVGWSAGLGAAPASAASAGAASGPYRLVSLDAAVPSGFQFFSPARVDDHGRVTGTLYAPGPDDEPVGYVATWARGRFVIGAPGIVTTASRSATGGFVPLGTDLWTTRAALFRNDEVLLLPRRPRERTSSVVKVTDSGSALVQWERDDSELVRYYLYDRGRIHPLELGPDPAFGLDVNDAWVVAGTLVVDGPHPWVVFRLDLRSNHRTLLRPEPGTRMCTAFGISRSGQILGNSFVNGDRGVCKIGVWRNERFRTWFTLGTPAFPQISNKQLWNGSAPIVITDIVAPENGPQGGYLLPSPGVRIDLAGLVPGLPGFAGIADISGNGNMVGVGGPIGRPIETAFILQRDGHATAPQATATRRSAPSVMIGRHRVPAQSPTLIRAMRRHVRRPAPTE